MRPSRIILRYGPPPPDLPGTSEVVITATLAEDITNESDITTGGNVITLTLTNDTWESTVGADNAITTALIAGLDSAQAEAAGWDAVVKAGLTYTAVTRTSDTLVTITLPAFRSYDITAQETITATIPASALNTSSEAVEASPSFTIDPVSAAGFFVRRYYDQFLAGQ